MKLESEAALIDLIAKIDRKRTICWKRGIIQAGYDCTMIEIKDYSEN